MTAHSAAVMAVKHEEWRRLSECRDFYVSYFRLKILLRQKRKTCYVYAMFMLWSCYVKGCRSRGNVMRFVGASLCWAACRLFPRVETAAKRGGGGGDRIGCCRVQGGSPPL